MELALFVIAALCIFSQINHATSSSRCPELTNRIPENIHPDTYQLFLHPRILEGTFLGTVTIGFNVSSPLKCLPVHTDGLIITHVSLLAPLKEVPLSSAYEMEEYRYYVLEPEQPLEPNYYTVTFYFSGSALDKMTGLYRSSYRYPGEDHDRYLMTTKFEPTDARKAFPCFDEPQLKSKFKISVVRPKKTGFSALSNTNSIGEVEGPGKDEVTVNFAETPAMSTYLVVAVVSDMENLGPVLVKGAESDIPLRVYATPHLVNNTEFAKTISQHTFNFFTNYFDIPFPLPKMDMMAIPDFISGAMENWGLVTYRETRLLVSNKSRTNTDSRKIAHVIAHELSHQWFGNLVTMKWWDDLWLNEGFARFMEYKGVDSLAEVPNHKRLINLEDIPTLHDLKMSVMVKDAFLNSHPIVVQVNNPEEISEIFDTISYGKGASILNMVEATIGEEAFRTGVQNYLKAHKFGNAASSDLWTSIGKVSNLNLVDHMATWINQTGYPVIHVTKKKDGFQIFQSRYLNDKNAQYSPDSSAYKYKWDIPICYFGSDGVRNVWLQRNQKKLILENPADDTWVKINCNGTGYYRVNYDNDTWDNLITILRTNHTFFSADDRANLLNDAFSLANSGHIPFSIPLRMSVYLSKERQRLPLLEGFTHLNTLRNKLGDSSIQRLMKKLVKTVYNNIIGDINWDFTKQQLTRAEEFYMLNMGCKNGIKNCRDAAVKHFRQWVDGKAEIVADLRSLVYTLGMQLSSDQNDWEKVLKRYQAETDPQEKELLMGSLVSTKDEVLLKRLLDLALGDDLVRPQDFFRVLSLVGGSKPELTWAWYKKNYPKMVESFTLSDKGLGRAFFSITGKFNTEEKLNEVSDFLSKNPQGGAATMLRKNAIEKISSNIKWIQRAKRAKFPKPNKQQ